MCYSRKDCIDSCMHARVIIFLAKKVKNRFLYLHNVSQTSIWENFANNVLLYFSIFTGGKKKKSNHIILCTWGKWGNQKRCKLLKIPSSPQLIARQSLPLTFGMWGCKIILYLRAREKQTRNSGSAFCGAAACRVLDTVCTEDSCWKHLCPTSSNFTAVRLIKNFF